MQQALPAGMVRSRCGQDLFSGAWCQDKKQRGQTRLCLKIRQHCCAGQVLEAALRDSGVSSLEDLHRIPVHGPGHPALLLT